MISSMLFSRPQLRDKKCEEEGEELFQDGGEWRGMCFLLIKLQVYSLLLNLF